MNLVDLIRPIKNVIPFIKNLHVPPGHFYSPIISYKDVRNRQEDIWNNKKEEILDINLNLEEQFNLIQSFKKFYDEIPFDKESNSKHRYYYNNIMYSYCDAIFLHCLLRKVKPSNLIEIGSGFSSALMLDTNDLNLNNKINLTFIEPYPNRLNSLLRKTDRNKIQLHQNIVQNIDLIEYQKLEENDILFIDSSHISKTGSDLNFIIFEILPRLKKGVYIHFHDIFFPFEYPKTWLLKYRRSWNEAYILRAFLMNNDSYKIKLFSTYICDKHKDWISQNMPLCLLNTGGNIWLQKT